VPGKVTFQGNPLTLVGRTLKAPTAAPDFKVVSQDLKPVTLSDFKAKVKILTSFPSLDTPVCDLQVKEFNKRATGLSSEVVIVGISKDLPFAQKRFCETFEIKNVTVVSDYQTGSFGINYGLLIKELNLLARSVLIVDKSDTLRYFQLIEEITKAPDYEDVLKNLAEILKSPAVTPQEALPAKCKPCEGGIAALPKEEIEKLLAQHRGWELAEDKKLAKEFKFKDFVEAKYFLDLVSVIAEEQGHHPAMTIIYNKVKITLTTHAAGGLTENDFIMARIIDELGS
jgi:thiol peroxidase